MARRARRYTWKSESFAALRMTDEEAGQLWIGFRLCLGTSGVREAEERDSREILRCACLAAGKLRMTEVGQASPRIAFSACEFWWHSEVLAVSSECLSSRSDVEERAKERSFGQKAPS